MGLPGIPTEDELQKLQVERKNVAAKRIQQEQKAAATAKLKYEQDIAKRSTRLSAVTGSSHRTSPQGKPYIPLKVGWRDILLTQVSPPPPSFGVTPTKLLSVINVCIFCIFSIAEIAKRESAICALWKRFCIFYFSS